MKTSDAAAISLSSLCLIHCLALPILASILPLFGVLSEAEWVHRLFVVTAVPISLLSFFATHPTRVRLVFGILALAGGMLLFLAAFIERLHDVETVLTVCGALLLAGAHLFRWRAHSSQ